MRTALLLSALLIGLVAAHAVIGLHHSQYADVDEANRDHSGGHYDWG